MISNAEEFVRLRTSEDRSEYEQAAHDEAPMEVWMDVIATRPDMRVWVAVNKTVPIAILEVLLDDEDWRVRSTVASKRKLPPHLLEVLSRDSSEIVRLSVVSNKKTPAALLHSLAEGDPSEMVRRRAADHLDRRHLP